MQLDKFYDEYAEKGELTEESYSELNQHRFKQRSSRCLYFWTTSIS